MHKNLKTQIHKSNNIILFFLSILIGISITSCDKEENCSADEPFSEPEWIREVQTKSENDSTICFADMRLFLWKEQYYLYQRTVFDEALYIVNTLYKCDGDIVVKSTDSRDFNDFRSEAEELYTLWAYTNEDCIWKSNFNENCDNIETDPGKIIIGKWERTRFHYQSVLVEDSVILIYYTVKPIWLEFKSNGNMSLGYLDSLMK